jgi:hypothetical protein
MRQVLFAVLSVIGLVAIAIQGSSGHARTRPAAAPAAVQDRYCLRGREWGYPGKCDYSTYDQCLATASGTDSYCDVNPQYLFADHRRDYWPRY